MRKSTTVEIHRAQEFKRVLSLSDLIWFGMAFIGPTAPYAMFGIATVKSEGHLPLVYLMAMVAMSFTAISYGQMARAFPDAGSTYTYSSKALSPVIGFFAGWGMILDYILIPMLSVIFLSLTLNKIVPQLPYLACVLSSAAAITGINLRGIRVTTRANYVLNTVMGASLVWFIAMAIRGLLTGIGAATLFSLEPFYNPSTFDFNEIMGATSLAVLSYIGFDGVTTLSEDAKDPERDIWRATVLVCFIAGGLFVLQSYLAQMAWPDYTAFDPVETAFMDIGRLVGGESLFYFISFVLVVAGFASAITGQASASRLLAGMGRDRLLPYRIFGYIHPKLGTPVRSIVLMGVLQVAGALVLQFAEVAELVNFGAFIGFMLVNVSVINHYFIQRGKRRGADLVAYLLLPLCGFAVCLFIWIHLSGFALEVGAAWMVLGVLYVLYLTRGLTRRLADLKL